MQDCVSNNYEQALHGPVSTAYKALSKCIFFCKYYTVEPCKEREMPEVCCGW